MSEIDRAMDARDDASSALTAQLIKCVPGVDGAGVDLPNSQEARSFVRNAAAKLAAGEISASAIWVPDGIQPDLICEVIQMTAAAMEADERAEQAIGRAVDEAFG